MTLETTGERFMPETMGGQLIEAEHVVRYALAAQLAAGRRVLDAGCGVGWGTAMLLAGGAARATGLDLSDQAVLNARRRVPEAEFVQGDLKQLPWGDEAFDLVVCFEALEHVADQEQVLDELVRVLATDGILLVSSPNPRVYPPGNPFHVHELTPEELVDVISQRLPRVVLWSQYSQIASVLVQEHQGLVADRSHEAMARAVLPLVQGSDPYSLVVGGRSSLPDLPPTLCLAPSAQLLHLEATSQMLSEEHARVAGERRRLDEERERLLADHSRMALDLDQLRRERERIGLLLLESEQELAVDRTSRQSWSREHEEQATALSARITGLERELDDVRRSTSWRLAAPLRAVSRLLSRPR